MTDITRTRQTLLQETHGREVNQEPLPHPKQNKTKMKSVAGFGDVLLTFLKRHKVPGRNLLMVSAPLKWASLP